MQPQSNELLEHRITQLEQQLSQQDKFIDDMMVLLNQLSTDTKVESSKLDTKMAVFTGIFVTLFTVVGGVVLEFGLNKNFG
jgi:uncharacterized coiled-coil protein SlyX